MPGIVGLITKMPQKRAENQLSEMVDTLRHESFYTTGTWTDPSLGVYAGWVARRDSFSEGMPLFNERNDVVLVFSGEEFPAPETVSRFRRNGHEVHPEDPAYLVHMYEDDPEFPAELNGFFHGLLVDQSKGLAMLFNDRFGMHRIYYYESKDAFYFAAEAKAILTVCPELRTLEARGFGEYISCGSVLDNRTLFKDIYVLPCAASWLFRSGTLERKQNYFHPREWEEQATLSEQAFYAELRDTFSRNLPRYFRSGERVAMSLTGGLDTRMVMAWQGHLRGELPCYSFGSSYRDSHDVRLARRVAKICGQDHHVIRPADAFLSQFPEAAERTVYLTDGCTNVGFSPVLYANQQAAKIGSVRMTGNYGDQVLRRIRTFAPASRAFSLIHPDVSSSVDLARATFKDLVRCNPLPFAVFKQAPWHNHGLLALEQTQLSMRSPFLDNDFVRAVYRAPESVFGNNDVRARLIKEGNDELGSFRTDLGHGGNSGRLRSLISEQLLLFTFRAEYAYDRGMPQWIARLDHLVAPLKLERLFLGRHKYYHFRVWYRDQLANYVQELLLDRQTLTRPFFDGKELEITVRDHIAGRRNHTSEIHQALSIELLHRSLLDQK